MEIQRLKAFCAVMKHGNMTEAAYVMKCQPSNVSRLIAKLEAELDYVLFVRQGKKSIPTPRATYLYKVADRIIRELEQTRTVLDEWESEAKGYLKVLTTPGMVNTWLIHDMEKFTDNYPDIKVRLIGNESNYDLEGNSADAAFLPYIENRPDLIQEYIMTAYFKPQASRSYLARFGAPKDINDLSNHRLISFYDKGDGVLGNVDWMLTEGMPIGKRRETFLQVNSSIALYYATLKGLGISSLSREYGLFSKSGLIDLFPDYEGHTLKMYYSYYATMKDSLRIQAFGTFLKKLVAKREGD